MTEVDRLWMDVEQLDLKGAATALNGHAQQNRNGIRHKGSPQRRSGIEPERRALEEVVHSAPINSQAHAKAALVSVIRDQALPQSPASVGNPRSRRLSTMKFAAGLLLIGLAASAVAYGVNYALNPPASCSVQPGVPYVAPDCPPMGIPTLPENLKQKR